MPYAVVVTGAEHVLAGLAPSLASPIATLRKRQGEWIIESTRFEPLEFDDMLSQCANELLLQIHQVLALYLGLTSEPLAIRGILKLSDDDKVLARRIISLMEVNVYLDARSGFPPTASGSLATDVLSRVMTDTAIKEALSLAGHKPLTWGQIYDILEFVGVRRSKLKQTANHYRHLGNPTKYLLPQNSPTLAEATKCATVLLKDWISTRI
jgi:hypothetical protein